MRQTPVPLSKVRTTRDFASAPAPPAGFVWEQVRGERVEVRLRGAACLAASVVSVAVDSHLLFLPLLFVVGLGVVCGFVRLRVRFGHRVLWGGSRFFCGCLRLAELGMIAPEVEPGVVDLFAFRGSDAG